MAVKTNELEGAAGPTTVRPAQGQTKAPILRRGTEGLRLNRRIRSDRGALLMMNSWGHKWGDGGAGWLPYTYVRERLAADFWTLLSPQWLASGDFRRPG